ncbi:MAG: aldose 1-epimerase family protein [Myxococcales bacterium]
MVRNIAQQGRLTATEWGRRELFKGAGAVAVMLGANAVQAAPASPPPTSGPAARVLAPTGTQYELRRGNQRAVVTEVGATLRSYQVEQREFLDTFAADEMSRYGMGHVLAPWPGRVDHGHYTFEGVAQQLPLNEVENQNALHGLVRFRDWKLVERTDDAVTQSLVLFPTEGYPYTLELMVTNRLTARGLHVETRATNLGAGRLPFGLGFHPYFNLGGDVIDSHVLTLPAATMLPTNERLIPTGVAPVAGTPFDFRRPKAIGAVKFDSTFTDLIRGKDGRARIRLAGPKGGPSIELAMDATFRYVVVYTQDTLPDTAHRRHAVCLEPLTCAPNAFNSGKGLLTLEPGKSYRGAWSLETHT